MAHARRVPVVMSNTLWAIQLVLKWRGVIWQTALNVICVSLSHVTLTHNHRTFNKSIYDMIRATSLCHPFVSHCLFCCSCVGCGWVWNVEARERYIYKSLSPRTMRQPFIILLLWLLITPLASSNYSTVHCANDCDIGINRRQCLCTIANSISKSRGHHGTSGHFSRERQQLQ